MAVFNTVPPLAAGVGIKFDGERISTAAAPSNLLDNSDFLNPVNQLGQTSYTSDHGGYTIDRWIANAAITLNVNTSSVTALSSGNTQNEFYQNIANPDRLLGKAITFAIKTDIGTFVTNATIPSDFAESWTTLGSEVDTDFGQIRFQMSDNSIHAILAVVAVKSGAGVTIHWAALYEGEYTAETLPEYQPKGYGAELAECQRYFVRIGSDSAYRIVGTGTAYDSSTCSVLVPLPVEMRAVPVVPITGQLILRNKAGNEVICSKVALDIIGVATAYLKCTVSGLTLGASYDAYLSPGNYLSFSANL